MVLIEISGKLVRTSTLRIDEYMRRKERAKNQRKKQKNDFSESKKSVKN